jgi:hypothetical protein
MNEQLETDLRRTLAQATANVPADAIGRITSTDYHPRTGWLTPWRAAGALAGTGAVGAAVATVLLAGATPAFAGWKATPERGHHGLSAAADSSCQSQLSTLPTAPGGPWSPVVTDVRGPYTLAVFEDQGVYGTCITGPSVNEASITGVNGGATSLGSSSGLGQGTASSSGAVYGSSGIESSFQGHLDSSSGPYTIMEGEVSSDVTGVTLVLQDGTDVGTTLGGGWFVAWWPNGEAAVSAEVTTPGGTTNQPLR